MCGCDRGRYGSSDRILYIADGIRGIDADVIAGGSRQVGGSVGGAEE